jgi:hypothetical protein
MTDLVKPVRSVDDKFDYTRAWDDPDADGFVPNASHLYGTTWCHYANKNNYRISGFVWFGDTDQWLIKHKNIAGGEYTRTHRNFFGTVNGVKRFERVEE